MQIYKESYYSYFFFNKDGGVLGYNALSNGLAHFNPASYEFYRRVISEGVTESALNDQEKELLANLVAVSGAVLTGVSCAACVSDLTRVSCIGCAGAAIGTLGASALAAAECFG